MMLHRVALLVPIACALLFTSHALAGPLLICQPYEIGSARSLPWTPGPKGGLVPDYPRQRLTADTLALLAPATPVIVRMETMRRATYYIDGHEAIGHELLSRLLARVIEAEARGTADPLAWFDAGYFVASLQQARHRTGYTKVADGLDGYAWVRRALQARGSDPDMEFAAALLQRESPQRPGGHLPRAQAGARPGSLLEKNVLAHFGH